MDKGWIFFDFWQKKRSDNIDLLFPGWSGESENLAVVCPHDDDGLLGAGYAMLAARDGGAKLTVFIVCDGSYGYSTPEQASGIVRTRARETLCSYSRLGVSADDIVRFDIPDYSVEFYKGARLPGGGEGLAVRFLEEFRRRRITRALIPNGYREHLDHVPVNHLAHYVGMQAGEAIIADRGGVFPIRSFHVYSVWSEFSPQESLLPPVHFPLRANKGILATDSVEARIMEGVKDFESQLQIIESIIEHRRQRKAAQGWLELYQDLAPRPRLDYGPYHREVDQLF